MKKIKKLIEKYHRYAKDPALINRTCNVAEVFALAAIDLEVALIDSEPPNLIAYIPLTAINLVHAGVHFDQDSEESWNELGRAAINMQNGDAS